MAVVISLGGSLINGSGSVDRAFLNQFKELALKSGESLGIVTGGGKTAREYASAAREFCGNNFVADEVAVAATRLNAHLMLALFRGVAHPKVFKDFDKAAAALEGHKIVVMGGIQPGQSTNAVGILAAESIRADLFVNATDVDGVYSSDPKKNPKAKRIDVIKTDELLTLTLKGKFEAGGYALFDPVAIRIVERSRICTRIIDGRKLENIEKAIRGEAVGTFLEPAEGKT